MLYASSPLDACQPLKNSPPSLKFPFFPFVVVARGVCTFEAKVEHAQNAGFAAVIVYNNEDNEDLVTMSGNPAGIRIPAVFVSKAAGDVLLKYAGDTGTKCYILPAFENTAWLRLTRESSSMSSREVKALPSFVFKCVGDGNATSETCAICLEDYETGEKLRVLPCHHEFHATCIDQWLTTRRPFCPICKRDAHSKAEDPPSENTPLLDAVPRVPLPVETHTSAAIQVSPAGSLHMRSSGSLNGSYMSSQAGSLMEAHAHLVSSENTPNDSPVGSTVSECYSSSIDAPHILSAAASNPGQCSQHWRNSSRESPEQIYHSTCSSGLSQSCSQLEFSPASPTGLSLHSASYTSSSALSGRVTTTALNPRSSSQHFRAGSSSSLSHLFPGSQSNSRMLGNHGIDQC
ncbi:hypothetical protein O6H91_17G087600 [Diphasiastrum complanatum]|uniref:Uncharacterized protein n=1 Tax=Diphasiastrum complanatum TaxID=34168 RepID=A0ACC2B8V5_DIPCM|nr:hypothetical protein O6H91_17G087600 [Diphasiastrum complanatum]